MARKGYPFRETAIFVTDDAGDTPVAEASIGNPPHLYPNGPGGFGYESLTGLNTRNRNAGISPKIAGAHYIDTSGTLVWKKDLGDVGEGPGTYRVWVLMGDDAAGWSHVLQIKDGSTVRHTVSGSTAAARWIDTTNTTGLTAANIAADAFGYVEVLLSTGVLTVEYGNGSGSANSFLAYVGYEKVVTGTAPSITDQPDPVTVTEGTTANFTVAATGTGTLTYQWQVDTGSGFVNVSSGTGGTSASYTTAATTLAMNGYDYRCIVTGDTAPPATSSSANLTVNAGGAGTLNLSASTQRFRDNTRVANSLANRSVTLRFRHITTGAVVASTTRTTDANGSVGSFSLPGFAAATQYRMHYLFEDGEYGVLKVTTEA